MVQWLRIHLAMNKLRVQSPLREVRFHRPWSKEVHTQQLLSPSSGALVPQIESSCVATTEVRTSGAHTTQLPSPHTTTRESKSRRILHDISRVLQQRPYSAKSINKSLKDNSNLARLLSILLIVIYWGPMYMKPPARA